MRHRICFFLLFLNSHVYSQTDKLNQFWNEYAFTKDLSQKWMLELNAGLTSSSVHGDSNIFYNVTQVYARGWAHYYPAEKWKISVFYSFYSNQNVPELNQKKAPEFRTALQATYSVLQTPKVKVNLRGRIEDRHIENDDEYLEAVQRFRFQIKAVSPINTFGIKTNALYVFASDELFFKTSSKVSGSDFFDRNRATFGLGLNFTNDMQIEAAYANEIVPREASSKLINAFQLKCIFNNFFPNLIKSFKRKKSVVDQGDGNLQ
ncbi:DUF2490 domain-containing protein [Flavobacterium aquidurense]|uniref:DUF2490 domain-containing protein n=1 Tax=Flavobacterium aquidurense TaxID=362413 RepID=UPI0037223EB6